MNQNPKRLDYATPSPPAPFPSWIVFRVAAWVGVIFAAFVVPLPSGIWYFGPRSQWLIAIEWSGLTVGSSRSPEVLGWWPLVTLKLLVLLTPYWIYRQIRRQRESSGKRA